ncbi:MAG: hypothetical protein H6642_15700 [Caldilineaceae bacterium]|nr:hypothetical protein [Caldilineaceae bacterium]MCB9139787.1 hypothetical protein [Caldilineaceae bacterium]
MKPKTKAIILGGLAGASLGALFAWSVTNVDEDDGEVGISALGPGDFVGIGIAVLSLARQFSEMIRK